ncbi:MAG: alpha/beta hydrolase [Lutibacter sp.]|nr:MAG: alpha/beta hydrolase [Lutibacter sp.]
MYCVPGLSASSKIFEFVKLPKEDFEIHLLEWLIPESINETIEHYAKRMCETITEESVVLMGVSFGGVMVQEMSRIIHPKKIILISSIKNKSELPKRLKLAKSSRAYKLFPTKSITSIENFMSTVFGKMAKKRIEQYKKYLSVRDPLYLKWSVYNVLHWQQEETLPNILHIHGTSDHIFPFKHIKNSIEIKNASHVMVLNRAKEISKIIVENINN